ncbi:MAG: ArsR family transcriptional regulator, partial [Streptomycetaceae bacterium]|nr:ArsR family transcriptional regulator [Streptomycetaceae bacterium]
MIALALARRGVPLTNKSFRMATGVTDSREAGRLMKDLVDRGVLTMTGTRGSAIYGLPARHTDVPPDAEPDTRVLAALAQGPRTRSDLEGLTGMTRHQVLYHLRRLRDGGRVELIGKERSKSGLWRAT